MQTFVCYNKWKFLQQLKVYKFKLKNSYKLTFSENDLKKILESSAFELSSGTEIFEATDERSQK